MCMGRVKRRGRWAQCDYGGLTPPQYRRVAASEPTNDKKQALPATQKPRVMRILLLWTTRDAARKFGGSGDAQTHVIKCPGMFQNTPGVF